MLPYERQLEVKQAQVDEALRRIGKLDGFTLEPILPAPRAVALSQQFEYSFGTDASGSLVCGFHAPGRWDEIVGLTDCLLASHRANEARARIVAVVPRAGPERLMTVAPARACCEISWSARAGARDGFK